MVKAKIDFFSGFYSTVGWLGMGIVLFAYALVSFGIVQANGALYQALNLIGALGIITVSLDKKAYQPAVLNIIWGIVAATALLKAF